MGIQIGEDIQAHMLRCEARYWIAWVRTIKPEFRMSRWQAQKKRLINYRSKEYVNRLVDVMNAMRYGEETNESNKR